MQYDVFISHASEDKKDFVEPLVQRLIELGLAVWYDDFSLKLGDILTESIDRGLERSRYGIVVLSKNFFAKEWPKKELGALTLKQKADERVIIPVWYQVSRDQVAGFSLSLSNIKAISSDRGVIAVAQEIYSVVRAPALPDTSLTYSKVPPSILDVSGFEESYVVSPDPGLVLLDWFHSIVMDSSTLPLTAIQTAWTNTAAAIKRARERRLQMFQSKGDLAYEDEFNSTAHHDIVAKVLESLLDGFPSIFWPPILDIKRLCSTPQYASLFLCAQFFAKEELKDAADIAFKLRGCPIASYIEAIYWKKKNCILTAKVLAEGAIADVDNSVDLIPFFGLMCPGDVLRAMLYRLMGSVYRDLPPQPYDNKSGASSNIPESEEQKYNEKAIEAARRALLTLERIASGKEVAPVRDEMYSIPIDYRERPGKEIAHAFFSYGYAAFEDENWSRAEELFQDAINALQKADVKWDSPYTRMGILLVRKGNIEKARQYFEIGADLCRATRRSHESLLSLSLCLLGLAVTSQYLNEAEQYPWEARLREGLRRFVNRKLPRPLECHRNDARILYKAYKESEWQRCTIATFISILNAAIREIKEAQILFDPNI